MDADSIDACITDPPYHLTSIVKRFGNPNAAPAKGNAAFERASRGFMGKQWDGGDIAARRETWEAVYRVLKPGAHLLAFGGTRTFHRMACAIEDAGFELRDCIMWLYGTGFPKSHDVSKAIDKAAGVKGETVPVGEPVKRMIPGADQGRDGWIKDDGRIYQPGEYEPATAEAAQWQGWGTALKPAFEPIIVARKPLGEKTVAANVLAYGTGAINIDACRVSAIDKTPAPVGQYGGSAIGPNGHSGIRDCSGDHLGRHPANVIHDGSDEVEAAFAQFGERTGGGDIHKRSSPKTKGVYGEFAGDDDRWSGYTGSGTASRFFYSAKATADDRHGSKHPTVKPTDLMRYLCKLVTPPGGTVLDPFCGTGSTLLAADQLQFNAIGIEQDETYAADARRKFEQDAGLFAEISR